MNKLYHQIEAIFNFVKDQWQLKGHDPDSFAQIAKEALALPTDYDFDQILEFTNGQNLPAQSYPKDEFGEVPFTIFRDENFFIDIYVWNMHNTSIHDHNFTGAFKLLHGLSKKFNYEFEVETEITSGFSIGNLKTVDIKDFNPGEIELITPYESFIHKIAHLTNPSVTLLIRTNGLSRPLNLYSLRFKVEFHRTQLQFVNKFNVIRMIYSRRSKETAVELKKFILKMDPSDLVSLLMSFINIHPAVISNDIRTKMHEDFKQLSLEGVLPSWFDEFLKLEVAQREKELRFQKLKMLGIL